MKIANQPEPVRIVIATAMIVVLINVFAWRLNSFVGICILPFATFAVAVSAIRISAPWYLKRRVLKHLRLNNGRAHLDDMVARLAPDDRPGVDGESASHVVRVFIEGMEKDGIIQIDEDGMVVKAHWGRVFH